MKSRKPFLLILILSIISVAIFMPSPVFAEAEPGILTPPAVEDGIIYFIHWPESLYAFDESANEIRWHENLDPLLDLDNFDPLDLPAPSPVLSESFVIVHLGKQLWIVSKIDGTTIWSIDTLPPASRKTATASSNTLPGFYLIETGSDGGILTLEEESGFWFCRRRMLGSGDITWENRIPGEAVGWWYDRDALWIAYEKFGESGPGSSGDEAGAIVCYDPEDGVNHWNTPVIDGSMMQAAFRVENQRVYIIERKVDGEFEVRGFSEDTGDLYKRISYFAGDFIQTLVSTDKIIFLHRDGSEDSRQAKFHLYYSSLNPIRFQTLMLSRDDQLFSEPVIHGNLFMYAGTTYSIYDGTIVWQEHVQRKMVDWTADDYILYVWDSAGWLIGFDRLTGQELWRTQFNVLPPDSEMGPNHGGASLVLADDRLFAGTPDGELVRINPDDGEIYPGVLRITSSMIVNTENGNGADGGKNAVSSLWIWITILIIAILGGFFLWFGSRKPMTWDDKNAKPGF